MMFFPSSCLSWDQALGCPGLGKLHFCCGCRCSILEAQVTGRSAIMRVNGFLSDLGIELCWDYQVLSLPTLGLSPAPVHGRYHSPALTHVFSALEEM